MLKIKIYDITRHRNETTFRPYIQARHLFWDIGVRFMFEGDDFDMEWMGQASFSRKDVSLEESIQYGTRQINKRIQDKVVLFDGQDSASLIGTGDFSNHPKVHCLKKNTLYKDKDDYLKSTPHGRTYWKRILPDWPDIDYSIPEVDFSKVHLSGTNWLSTVTPNWFDLNKLEKDIDVFAVFSYPSKDNYEFQRITNGYYDQHRKKCINQLNALPKSLKVVTLPPDGKHFAIEEYYALMKRSKIIIAPFGYGEIAPRDLESAMVGAVLIKPNMDHIETTPNIYKAGKTFVNCQWDFSDLHECIESVLGEWKENQAYFVNNMRNEYAEHYDPIKLVEYTHDWISKIEGYGI